MGIEVMDEEEKALPIGRVEAVHMGEHGIGDAVGPTLVLIGSRFAHPGIEILAPVIKALIERKDPAERKGAYEPRRVEAILA